jgi:hypothetical protein
VKHTRFNDATCAASRMRHVAYRALQEMETNEKAAKKNPADSRWELDSNNIRASLGMTSAAQPWTKGAKLAGVPKGSKRVLDCIDVCYQAARNQCGHVPLDTASLWCDPSQSCKRKPLSYKCPLLTQRNLPYSFEFDTALSGRDALRLQGFPAEGHIAPPHLLTDSEARSLAGESFYLPTISTITYAYYLNSRGPWWSS